MTTTTQGAAGAAPTFHGTGIEIAPSTPHVAEAARQMHLFGDAADILLAVAGGRLSQRVALEQLIARYRRHLEARAIAVCPHGKTFLADCYPCLHETKIVEAARAYVREHDKFLLDDPTYSAFQEQQLNQALLTAVREADRAVK